MGSEDQSRLRSRKLALCCAMPTPSRYRTLKRVLRFMPRRAVLHRYPFIGRFAHKLRWREYLWSLRRTHMRRAYYAGAVLALLPLFGVQLPLALVAALLLRCNLMVLAGLQFITNPLTAGPIYYLTHALGGEVLQHVMPEPTVPVPADESELIEMSGYVAGAISEPLIATPLPVKWTTKVRRAVGAMVIGGIIAGTLLALVLDALDRLLRRPAIPALRSG